MALLDSQFEPYRQLRAHLVNETRALLVMATGLGKTWVVAHFVKEELVMHGRGLVLCHDVNILTQNLRVFREVLGEKYSLGVFHGQQKDLEEVNVLFATFQTFHKWKNAFFKDEFHFVLVDEAHHSEANTFKSVIDYFTPRFLLGMTATPDRADDRDICETFGNEVVNISLEEGIANGWLASVEYHLLSDHINGRIVNRMLSELHKGGDKVSVKQLNQVVFIERRDEEVAQKILAYGDRALVFCEGVLHANTFAKVLPCAATLHSGNSAEENAHALQAFKDKVLNFLVVVDKLNEGIDIPHVELIVFLRTTDSSRIFVQQLGRGLRKTKKKEKVIVLDFVGNCDRVAVVQQLVDRVKDYSMQGQVEYDRGPYFLKGTGFTFDFDDTLRDLKEILFLLKQKRFISEISNLAAEFHPTKNAPLTAEQVMAGTDKKLWWKCQVTTCGHEWEAVGRHRLGGRGCPACINRVVTSNNSLKVVYPDLAREFHPTKNAPLTPEMVVAGTNRKLWWKCQVTTCGHEWEVPGCRRVQGGVCPACANRVVTSKNCLATTHPELVKEFHPTKNAPLTVETAIVGTSRKLWWKCQVTTCGHEWKVSGCRRVQCPVCTNKVVTSKNCLATTHPELVKEFHPTKNAPLTVEQVTAGTSKKLWWKCATCGHEWQAVGYNRAAGGGCRLCSYERKRVTKKG